MRQNGRKSIWVFGIVDAVTGWSMVSAQPESNTVTMRLRLWFRDHHWSNRVYPGEPSLIPQGEEEPVPASPARGPFNLCNAVDHAQASIVSRIS